MLHCQRVDVTGFEVNKSRAVSIATIAIVLRRGNDSGLTSSGKDLLRVDGSFHGLIGCASERWLETSVIVGESLLQFRLQVRDAARGFATESHSAK